MSFASTPVTRDDVMPVLSALANIDGVLDIFVIGSIAREGQGNDLDVVVVVDMFTYIAYLKRMWGHYQSNAFEQINYYENFREQRMVTALDALNVSPTEYGWLDCALRHMSGPIDVHLMPENWQEHIDAVQEHLPHDDPKFVRNIAGDAKRVLTTIVRYRNVRHALYWK